MSVWVGGCAMCVCMCGVWCSVWCDCVCAWGVYAVCMYVHVQCDVHMDVECMCLMCGVYVCVHVWYSVTCMYVMW